ncbi:MAG: LPS export ABC transporter periplasmic protein LptC [Chlorobi bacterium]|nr:LPS export ABC transporter periplasmic protein LptC [Chlorobiota bacterium]
MIKILIKSIVTLFVVVMLFSCENSITTIQEITRTDTLPLVTAYNIEYERTDSGYLRVLLRSSKMERFEGKEPYTVFPDGFEITFYDTTGVPVSFIRANYGISYEKKKIMQARNDVVVKNFDTQEQLNTENLVWDQKKKTIFSNTFVKITSPDKIIYGDSLRSNESFTDRSIYHIRGELEVMDDTASAKK